MTRETSPLLPIFISVYFGESMLARLLNTNSSVMRQLALFLILLALFRLVSIRLLAWGAVVATVLLAGLVAVAPTAVPIYAVTVMAYGVSLALLVRILVEVWHTP